uniref:Uncharacterized protein n=1 Tax=Arundo donax TaxID=35708 RepID=A0A0A9BZK2_ARUDO
MFFQGRKCSAQVHNEVVHINNELLSPI